MSTIWFNKDVSIESMNKYSQNTLVSHIGIILTKMGDDTLEGTMPVDERTFQPARLLHGGASCVLAETLGSVAANMTIDTAEKMQKFCIKEMKKDGINSFFAWLATRSIPKLERWKR